MNEKKFNKRRALWVGLLILIFLLLAGFFYQSTFIPCSSIDSLLFHLAKCAPTPVCTQYSNDGNCQKWQLQ